MSEPLLLDSTQMATFVARGFLRFDAAVPEELNRDFLAQVDDVPADSVTSIREHYGRIMAGSAIPRIAAGTPLEHSYDADSPLGRIVALPVIQGAIRSLVGEGARFDHHFLHLTYPPAFYPPGREPVAQHYHQDSTIDPRQAFDIQLMYFPHQVTAQMGGTRFLPGSHLRIVSEAAIARYQNLRGQQHVVCPAGTLLVLHHGIWHGGGVNRSNRLRYMFKIRLGPTRRQRRLWDTTDLPAPAANQRAIFWTDGRAGDDAIAAILTRPEPWFEADTGRLEYLNRVRLWRYLLGDDSFDADYWLTRVENEPS